VPKLGSTAFPLAVARSWLSTYPVDLWKWRVRAVREHVSSLIATGTVDLCVADFLFAAANLPFDGTVPVLLFEHNVEYLIWQRLAALESRPWRKALFEIEWRKLRAREADACRRADLTVAVSDEDRVRLNEIAPEAATASIPTGVDTAYFKPSGPTPIPGRLVFSGSMDWQPNEDAVIYFTDTILPLVREEIPDASFTVVGRNPSARLREFAARTGIALTGTVDDVRPYLDEGDVYVVPLRAGSGTRLKIFEALAMGKAVVSTTVGAEGLSVTPGRDVVLADAPEDLAAAVISLLRDPTRKAALGRAGQALVRTHYSWEQVARVFEQCCETAVATSRTAVRSKPPALSPFHSASSAD
jgi:glycosyltransferase involved in cell wall biosynthesis